MFQQKNSIHKAPSFFKLLFYDNYLTSLKIKEAFCPPKPNELDNAA